MKANLNIWSIEKDSSIKIFLLLLDHKIGTDNFCISENIHLDCRAVRLYKNNDYLNSAYIYTYGQLEGLYGIHLEFPMYDETDISDIMDIYEGVSFDKVVELLSTHFDLTGDYRVADL